MTSVFLAREFGVRVYAVDLWEPPDETHIFKKDLENGEYMGFIR
jgi:hypothetical protein